MRSIFFYTIGIAFMSGIFVRSFLYIDSYGLLFLGFLGCALLVSGMMMVTKYTSPLFVLGIALIAGTLGMFRLHVETLPVSAMSTYENQDVELIGKVVREPEERENTMHYYIKPEGSELFEDERVLVTTEKFKALEQTIRYGDIVRASGTLKRPEAFMSDGGRVFDYPGYLKTKGVTYTMQFADVARMAEGDPTIISRIYVGKERFQDALEQAIPMPHAGLGEGILLGVKRALGSELEQTFRETGIIHIVVLSGYNVMIVVEALMVLLSYFFLPRMRMIIGIGAIAVFVILVGPSATVVRASLMATLLLIARATGRTYMILRALILAGIIMLLVNPYLLVHDPGFQLSFLATLSLILLAPYVEQKLTALPERFGMRKIVTATLVTQIFVLPLLLYHTGLLSLVSVLVNALVLPMVPIAMLLTFLTGVLGIIAAPLGTLVGFIAYGSLGYIIFISEFFGSLPFSSVVIAHFPAWIMFLAYGIMAVWLTILLTRKHESLTVEQSLLAGWTIEEEREKTGEEQSSPPVSPLPFR